MSKLKPCPFCGCKDIKLEQYEKNGMMIKCKNCLLQKKQRTLMFSIKWLEKELIKSWNKRTESTWDLFSRLLNNYSLNKTASLIPGTISGKSNNYNFVDFIMRVDSIEALKILKKIKRKLK